MKKNLPILSAKSRNIFCSLVLIGAPLISNAKVINDRLVKDLSCQSLTNQSIYQSIREDAFSSKYHFPVQNWATGVIANCWSLSHAQRMHFYLSRIGDKNSMNQKSIEMVLNIIRGSVYGGSDHTLILDKKQNIR